MNGSKKKVKLDIKKILSKSNDLTFLIGAGCSIDAPSCLPSGREMIESIVKYTCAESEIDKILGLESLRFESLIEIIREDLDKNLKLIDYYGQCDKPKLLGFC